MGPNLSTRRMLNDSMAPMFRKDDVLIVDSAMTPAAGDYVIASNGVCERLTHFADANHELIVGVVNAGKPSPAAVATFEGRKEGAP